MSNLIEKSKRSWELLLRSLQVIAQNKKLLLFPVIISLFSVVVMLFFFVPAVFIRTGHPWASTDHWKSAVKFFGDLVPDASGKPVLRLHGVTYACAALIYLVSMFIATFFNVAFYHEILRALAGEAVSIRNGLRFACGRIRAILMWSLFAGVVGLIIQALEARFGWFGRMVLRFIGVVWSVASVFAIPVLIREETANPITLLQRSASTLKKSWGESLIGYVGITVGSWLALLVSLVFLGGALLLSIIVRSPVFFVAAFPAWLLSLIALGFVASLAGHIYRCALYVYASEGVVPGPFSEDQMNQAWKVRGSKAT